MALVIELIKLALAGLHLLWRESSDFFLSIEFWLMLLVSGVTVGAVWLAYLGDLRCLLCFGFALGYLCLRVSLHLRRVLSWPFI